MVIKSAQECREPLRSALATSSVTAEPSAMASLPKPVAGDEKKGDVTVILGSQWGDEGKGMCMRATAP